MSCSKVRSQPWRSHFADFFQWKESDREDLNNFSPNDSLDCAESVYSKIHSTAFKGLSSKSMRNDKLIMVNSNKKNRLNSTAMERDLISITSNGDISLDLREESMENDSSLCNEREKSIKTNYNNPRYNNTLLERIRLTTSNMNIHSSSSRVKDIVKFLPPLKLPSKISNSHILK